jgi:hypothetical protein
MIKFNGITHLNNVIISNSVTAPSVPNVTTQWPASQPLLFDQTQPESDLWGVLNFEAPVGLLSSSGESYVDFIVNPNSSPSQDIPGTKAFTWINGTAFTHAPTGSDTPTFYDKETSVDSTPLGGEGAWSDSGDSWQYAYFYRPVTNPVGVPNAVIGQRKKLGDVSRLFGRLRNDKTSKVAVYFTPDANMPQSKTFIDNWGPQGFFEFRIRSKAASGAAGNLDGTRPVNALVGIVKKSAISTLPSVIAFSDIVCGLLIRNNDAIYIQNGVEVYRSNTTANPGALAPDQPGGGGYVNCTASSSFINIAPDSIEYFGYDGITQAINQSIAPNGLSDFTTEMITPLAEAYVPIKNGTHVYPVAAGGKVTTTTINYNAVTNSVLSSSIASGGTNVPSEIIDYSELALVAHNETNLVGVLDGGEEVCMEITFGLYPDYDRESTQCRSF